MLGALLMTRAIATLLYGVGPRDPGTLVALSATLTRGGALRLLHPGAAGDESRSDPRAAIRVSALTTRSRSQLYVLRDVRVAIFEPSRP